MHFFKIILSGYEFQYLVPSFLFILAFKAQSIAAVTPAIPGKWRVVEIKTYPCSILSEGVNLDATWCEFLWSLIGASHIDLGSELNDSADH